MEDLTWRISESGFWWSVGLCWWIINVNWMQQKLGGSIITSLYPIQPQLCTYKGQHLSRNCRKIMIHSSYQLDMQIGAFLLILPFIFLYIYIFWSFKWDQNCFKKKLPQTWQVRPPTHAKDTVWVIFPTGSFGLFRCYWSLGQCCSEDNLQFLKNKLRHIISI